MVPVSALPSAPGGELIATVLTTTIVELREINDINDTEVP